MTELDFDELDKAVNSLMADNGTPDTSATVTTPVVPTPNSPATTPSPAVRRRGQFMDVMHPSANMRPTSAPVKGQGVTIVPPTMEAATTPDTDIVPPVDVTPESSAPLEIVPAPLTEDVSLESAADTPQSTEESEASNALNELVISEDPLSSPFLPDAKVDKRPLGSTAPLADSATSEGDPEGAPSVDVVEQAAPEPEKTEEVKPAPVPLPDELKDDVVAVEANEVVREETTPGVPAQDVPSAMTVPATGGNIVQQYEEQPSTGDLTNGAIYDTSTYHQALEAQPAKKKSKALVWVLWIVVLLIVGATAGAAWFYFTTQ